MRCGMPSRAGRRRKASMSDVEFCSNASSEGNVGTTARPSAFQYASESAVVSAHTSTRQ